MNRKLLIVLGPVAGIAVARGLRAANTDVTPPQAGGKTC